MQLGERECRKAKVFPAPFGPSTQRARRVVGKDLGDAPAAFRRDHDPVVRALGEEPAHQALAAAVAVDVRRVKKTHPGVGRRVQRRHGRGVAHVAPIGAELPAPLPNNAYVEARSSQAGEFPCRLFASAGTGCGTRPGRRSGMTSTLPSWRYLWGSASGPNLRVYRWRSHPRAAAPWPAKCKK